MGKPESLRNNFLMKGTTNTSASQRTQVRWIDGSYLMIYAYKTQDIASCKTLYGFHLGQYGFHLGQYRNPSSWLVKNINAHTSVTSISCQFDFMMSSITYSLVDGVTSFFQLMDVQNIRKSAHFSLQKIFEKFYALFKLAESL